MVTSFILIESLESKQAFDGNSINTAGKNRFLTEMVLNAVKDNYIGEKSSGDPISALAVYENNLQLLKTGGTQMGAPISPLPKEFQGQWENIHNLYLDYQAKIQSFVKSDSANYRKTTLVEISSLADKLVQQNDILTVKMASVTQNSHTMQMLLQAFLVIINIVALLFMIKMIYNSLKNKAEQLVKAEKDMAVDRKYRKLYDGLPDLCRTINEDGIILDCNVVYANSLGYSKEEVIGKSIFEHVADKSFSSLHDSFVAWRSYGHVQSRDIWFKRKDGSIFPALLNATKLIDENYKCVISNTVIRDMSDIYNIRKELEDQKLKRLSAIGEIASRLAHDLRNPLSILKNTVEIIKIKYSNNTLDPVPFNTHCAKIDNAISRMSHQLDDVLDFVRISPLNLTEVSLLPFVRSICEKIPHSKNIKIELPTNYYHITCDEKKLEVVLTNLLVNAVDAIGDNAGKITIRFIMNDENMKIEITDTGSGIPEDIKDKIFEPLFTTKQKGTGLGLVSCKNIIEQHGGKIWAESKVGSGTTMYMSLPTKINTQQQIVESIPK
ncbi:MAG TPA: ATP-binding protein [Nitrosopumilaceae archaeon]|nr:ATP-binding protein [Nitrosopumilaceae archaeon]